MFEAWAPLGLLVHLAPTAELALLSLAEGMLCGNLNLVISNDLQQIDAKLLHVLGSQGWIASRLIVLSHAGSRGKWRKAACELADSVASWDEEDVSPYLSSSCRLVRRERKACAIYLAPYTWRELSSLSLLRRIVRDWKLIGLDSIYLDSDRHTDVSDLHTRLEISEQSEEAVKIEILPRARLSTVLWPMRRQIWTVGISGEKHDIAELSRKILTAGASRVVGLEALLDYADNNLCEESYLLRNYSRRIRVDADERFADDACIDDLVDRSGAEWRKPYRMPVLPKADAQQVIWNTAPQYSQLYFHSGGTTGPPGVSIYTYQDYDDNTTATADGFLAAGLDPRCDRVANLLYSGMGGGFVSFFEALERLTATQIPIGANAELNVIAENIIKYRADTLIGMPSHLWRLCRAEEETLRSYGGIRKIFYAGEQVSTERCEWFKHQLGVQLVKSAAYTTSDLGPLGYQCSCVTGAVYHLHDWLHNLEILDLEHDIPSDSGRLIFTRRRRQGQHLERYEIGDDGRWVHGRCECGRTSSRFELLGRHGDVMRIATRFIDFRRLVQIARERFSYLGDVQAVLDQKQGMEHLIVRMDSGSSLDISSARHEFLSYYPDLRLSVEQGMLEFSVELLAQELFTLSPTNGKVKTVVDLRRSLLPACGAATVFSCMLAHLVERVIIKLFKHWQRAARAALGDLSEPMTMLRPEGRLGVHDRAGQPTVARLCRRLVEPGPHLVGQRAVVLFVKR